MGWVGCRIRTLVMALAATALIGCRPDPPNILLIVADDLGAMDVGFANPDSLYETPNLDGLAASGVQFTHGYAASPVCSPTRYSLLTGRYPTRADATDFFTGGGRERFLGADFSDRMELSETTLPEVLKDGGYATFFAGKWHLGGEEELWPEHQGFDVNRGGTRMGMPVDGGYFPPYGNARLEDGPRGEHLPNRLARETVRFIEDHRREPFFAMLSFYSVHTPLQGRPDLVEKYRQKVRRLESPDGAAFAAEEESPRGPAPVRLAQRDAVYAAMVEAMDQAVGMVLDAVTELGLEENTVVVFVSDNGGLSTGRVRPTSNLPLRGGKGWLFEGGLRVPFVIRSPSARAAGGVADTPVMTTDLYPTLLAMAGLQAPAGIEVDGVDLEPLLTGSGAVDREALFWHYPHYSNQWGFPGAAVRVGDLKLIEFFEDGRLALFDLSADEGERDDLAASRPDEAAALRARLHDWYDEVDARFLRRRHGGPEPWRPR